jgi:hypothetical protein
MLNANSKFDVMCYNYLITRRFQIQFQIKPKVQRRLHVENWTMLSVAPHCL